MSGPSSTRSALAQALAVLEEVARMGPTQSANAIARSLELPRASAYRIINSLVSDEYLLRHPTLGGFVLGVRVVELAHLIAPRHESPVPAIVGDLRERTGEAVHFVRYLGGRVVIVDEDPLLPLSSRDRTRLDLSSTAIGQLLLWAFPPVRDPVDIASSQAVIETARSSGMTLSDHQRIAAEVTELGYARHVDPHERACIAVPVTSPEGSVVGALAIAVNNGNLTEAETHLSQLRSARDELTLAGSLEELGGIREAS